MKKVLGMYGYRWFWIGHLIKQIQRPPLQGLVLTLETLDNRQLMRRGVLRVPLDNRRQTGNPKVLEILTLAGNKPGDSLRRRIEQRGVGG